MKEKRKKSMQVFAWIIVILWMAVIFNFSAQAGGQSAGLSSRVTEAILSLVGEVLLLDVESIMTEETIENLHYAIRKMAHFFVYMVLGILMINALRKSGVMGSKTLVLALGLCILYATSDEIHQLYVPGRTGQVKDVLIDTIGAIAGIWGYRTTIEVFGRILGSCRGNPSF